MAIWTRTMQIQLSHSLLAATIMLWPSWLLAQGVTKRAPTAALIDTEGGVVGGLLEARLLEKGEVQWLERNEVQRILTEHKIGAVFGGAGGKERTSLGKLLKADLLVMVRRTQSPQDKAQELLECVVCETKQGLRLRIAFAPSGKEEESAAATFSDAFEAALRKFNETSREVVAAPPLVSDNLGFDKNYLQTAYSKLIEQALLDQPGVVVVELEEAQSIAREVAIAGNGRQVQRDRLPLYLLGNFRHSGIGDKTRIAVELHLKRGEQELGQRAEKQLSPQQMGVWLTNASLELLRASRTVAVAKANPKTEAKQLAHRAQEFFRIGNWNEALSLMEASLLLEPTQQDLHHDAVIAYGKLVPQNMLYGEKNKEHIAAAVAAYQRGLEHLEAFARTAKEMQQYNEDGQTDFVATFESGTNAWYMHPDTPPDVLQIVAEMLPVRRETYMRIARFRFARGFNDEFWLGRALQGLPNKEHLALTLKVLEEFQTRPDFQNFGAQLALYAGDRESPEYQQFLDGLSKSKSAPIRAVAESVRMSISRLDALRKEMESAERAKITEVAAEIVFKPISLTLPGTDFVPTGCVPAGDGRDVFFGTGALYLMETRGQLRTIWQTTEFNSWPRSLVYDGRYLWASFVRDRRSPLLIVVELESGKAATFKQLDGLPGDDLEHEIAAPREVIRIAPLAPGRVCLAGSLGRAWIGIAEFDGAKKSIRIIHEARTAANNADPNQGKGTAVAFSPAFAHTLSSRSTQGQLVQKVIVPRVTDNLSAREVPLWIDIPKEKVAAADVKLWGEDEQSRPQPETRAAIVDGNLLMPGFNTKQAVHELVSVSIDGKAKSVYTDQPEGEFVARGADLYIFGRQCWIFDTKTQKLRLAGSPLPWISDARSTSKDASPWPIKRKPDDYRLERVYASNHYGIVVFTVTNDGKWQLYEGIRKE